MKLITGIILVLVSVVIFIATFFPLAQNEFHYQLGRIKGPKTEKIEPLYPDFGIIIPKLDINAKVIKDVDPYNAAIYQKALTLGVAHAKGTVLPGENGNIFIFSHSSENFYQAVRFNSIFYLLPKLEIGDEVQLFFENKKYSYTVSQKKIIDPQDISYLTSKTTTPTLTLMTCYPPGTDLKRYIIVAK